MRILFVAIGESVHTARWLSQIADEGWDLHLFPAEVSVPHPDYRNITLHTFYRKRWHGLPRVRQRGLYWPLPRGIARIKQLSEMLAPGTATPAARLARTIRTVKPDIVHVLEMQSAGYLMLEARKLLNGDAFPPCIYSCWGNDLYLFGEQPEHAPRIRNFISQCDYFIADCERDLALPRQYGFKGEMLGVFTTAGGYDLPNMRKFRAAGPSSARKVIALKGHQTIRGANARAAIRALAACADLLDGFEVCSFSTSDEIHSELEALAQIKGLRITELAPRSSHEAMLDLMGRARMAIGISASDGTPNAMLEAMVLGAFPIQTDTVSTAEWIEHGINGLLVSPAEPDSIVEALRKALTDDVLIDNAARVNEQLVDERLDLAKIQPQVIDLYKKVIEQGKIAGD